MKNVMVWWLLSWFVGGNNNYVRSVGYKDDDVNVLAVKPEIREPPRDEESVIGRDVTLLCRVYGIPKPEVKWTRNGIELTGGGRYTVQQNGDLLISKATFTDIGQYTCNARNKLGEVTAVANLMIKRNTLIRKGPDDYEVKAGAAATFRCSAEKDDTLDLEINWLRNGEVIDFKSEPRFVKTNDYSLTITETNELDSGVYSCIARTRLDEATAQATLMVQDAPNAPKLLSVVCNAKDASLTWQPMGDNRAPILNYVVQYNTSFTPDVWLNVSDSVPPTHTSYMVPLSPWANYTFRLLARNKIGVSLPSDRSHICATEPDIPYKNPSNVEAKGTAPDNLVITWTPMSEIEHNAPRFRYRIFWKRDVTGSNWTTEDVSDWRVGRKEIRNQPTFQPYVVKAAAVNERGLASVPPTEVYGYSGEDAPTEAPTNLTLIEVSSATAARVAWHPVHPESIKGHFKGYKIQTWSENQSDEMAKETTTNNATTQIDVNTLSPFSKNYVRVFAFNGVYNGPLSHPLVITTPEGVPGPVASLTAIPLSSFGFYLTWKKPLQPNGILTGYRVYYQTVYGTKLGPILEKRPGITDPEETRTKLANLESAPKYRIHIKAVTAAGEGSGYWIERNTRSPSVTGPPNKPTFIWSRVSSDEGFPSIRITWIPDEQKPGSHFRTIYRVKGETTFQTIDGDQDDHFVFVRRLQPDKIYEFATISTDGSYSTQSDLISIDLRQRQWAMISDFIRFFRFWWF